MADHPESESAPVGFPHQVIEHLTLMKLLVGSLRRHLHQDVISPEAIETHLARIEEEIDAAATLAQDVQAQEERSA